MYDYADVDKPLRIRFAPTFGGMGEWFRALPDGAEMFAYIDPPNANATSSPVLQVNLHFRLAWHE